MSSALIMVVYSKLRNRQNEQVRELRFSDKRLPQYPHEKLGKGNKPSIQLIRVYKDLDSAREDVADRLSKGSLTAKHAAHYLYLVFSKVEYELEEDWETYGITLGKKGDKVTINNLVDWELTGTATDGQSSQVKEEDDPWLCVLAAGHLRLAAARVWQTYQTSVQTTLLAMARSVNPGNAPIAFQVSAELDTFDSNQSLIGVCAAIDMISNKFPGSNEDLSKVKISTLVTRYKDCTVFSSISGLSRFLGISVDDVVKWIFDSSVASELDALLNDKEEFGDPNSYFPYQSSLGIVSKSYYSASSCPNLHFWLHTIGSLLGYERSQSARLVKGTSELSVGKAAFLATLAFADNSELALAYTESQVQTVDQLNAEIRKEVEEVKGFEDDTDTDGGETSERDLPKTPEAYLKSYKLAGGQFSPAGKKWLVGRIAMIKNPRKGTIGERMGSMTI